MEIDQLKSQIKLSRKACEGVLGGILVYNSQKPPAQWSAALSDTKGVDNTELVWHNIDRTSVTHDNIVCMSQAVFLYLGLDKKNIRIKTRGE
jgi:hypothetical protein